MSLLSWFTDQKKPQTSPKFIPKIVINKLTNLYVEVEPKDPNNCSNIVITAFISEQLRSIVPIRVEWSRFKVKAQSIHSVQKIHCLVGNSYMCEPGDVGAYIKANIKSVDESIKGEAEVTVGPICIDVMMKRLIQGAMYSHSLLSQVVVCEKDRKNNVSVRLNPTAIELTDDNSGQKLVKEYTISQPKIQLNPKDPTRVYLRFNYDHQNKVRQWLNSIYNIRNASLQQSSMSAKVPYKSHSQSSSKMRLFQKSQITSCINKIEMRFISRTSRDLFLFTQRAFICREDMKNSVYIQRLQTLQTIANDDDYYRFLGYISLKNEIIRLADFAKELEDDRNAKVKDLEAMEESIGDMTLTYLKIIEEKGKNQHVDFEASYSQISLTRQEIMGRKNIRQIKKENQNLKQRLRQMNEQIELLKFFKKEENESMIFNQTSNPFAKKPANEQSVSYQINVVGGEQKKNQRNNMYQMSLNYTKILQQNNQLKKQLMTNNKKNKEFDVSRGMIEILGDLEEKEEHQNKYMEYQKKITMLANQNQELKKKNYELINTARKGINLTANKSFSIQDRSIISNLNHSGSSSVADSSMNQSITSEAAMAKLEENLVALSTMNAKLQQDVSRLRRQRDYYRNQASKLNDQVKQAQQPKFDTSNIMNDNSVLYRFKEQNEILQNEKKALLKKIQSLSKQNASGIRQDFVQKQKKLKEYEQLVDRLKLQNIALNKKVEEIQSQGDEADFWKNDNIKLKKINSELLQEIKSLKIQLQIKGNNLYNSRVIEMQNELQYVRSLSTPVANNQDTALLLNQITDLKKKNTKLQRELSDLQAKFDHQTVTVEKLMRETSKIEQKPNQKKTTSSSSSTKEKAYSEKCNQATVQELEKYKRQIKKLQQEIIFMKKSSDAINRSRDLTLEMDGFHEEKMEVMKKELQALYHQNQNLSKMCERYGKDAREAHKEVNKWREKAMQLMKARTEEHSLISNS